jgi:aminodeoxyfutalosine deaminase
MNLQEFARRMPKADLHVHLEGSILPHTLLELSQRNRVNLPASDEAGVSALYKFRDFGHFLDTYLMITGCLRTPEDYRLIAYEYGRECARQNVRYSEVTFTILTNAAMTGLPWQQVLGGLNAGRKQAQVDFGVQWQWVFDIVRNQPETQSAVLDISLAARQQGVVALGLGGQEQGYPPELFVETFERAQRENLHRVPHAGEISGPPSVWGALRLLHAERIGHGVRCIEDPHLVQYLQANAIPLEVCPSSNIRLGVYPDYAQHPLRRLWQAGLMIAIGSDDPPMFGTDLNREYRLLVDEFGFSQGELEQASLNGLRASFLTEPEKQRFIEEFEEQFQSLSKE